MAAAAAAAAPAPHDTELIRGAGAAPARPAPCAHTLTGQEPARAIGVGVIFSSFFRHSQPLTAEAKFMAAEFEVGAPPAPRCFSRRPPTPTRHSCLCVWLRARAASR
jgi:hypothetical protein